jgi:acylphosphatase
MSRICRRCLVSGRVQGVWFRAGTAQQARRLRVTGYACNLEDGRVEVLACGEEPAVRALCDWLRRGPPGAYVAAVTVEDWTGDPPGDFTTG